MSLRVLLTHERFPPDFAGGGEAIALKTATGLMARGHDVRDHALVVFGGAGGQYACRVARTLGVRTLVFHPLAGVLSAWGMGAARVGEHNAVEWNCV